MTRVVPAHIWDAIERTSAQFGGVASWRIEDSQGAPVCVWGMVYYSGVCEPVNVVTTPLPGTYDWRQLVNAFGKKFDWDAFFPTSGLIGAGDFDRAIDTVRARIAQGPHVSARVPWSEVAKELGMVRGPSEPTEDDALAVDALIAGIHDAVNEQEMVSV